MKVSQMWNGNEKKTASGRAQDTEYNVIGRKQAVRRRDRQAEGGNLSEVWRDPSMWRDVEKL